MGQKTICFHCLEGELTLALDFIDSNEVWLFCGHCGSNFRFDKEKIVPIKTKRIQKKKRVQKEL